MNGSTTSKEELIRAVRDYYAKAAASSTAGPSVVRAPHCPVCGKEIYTYDAPDVEYIETKRRTQILIHTKCVRKWRNT